MGIIAKLTATEPFTPKWLEGEAAPLIFNLRAGDVIERELFEAQLAGPLLGAGELWPWQRHSLLLEGLNAIGGEDAPHLCMLAETAMRSSLDDPAEKALLQDVTALVAQHYGPYRAMVEQDERRQKVLPILALCRYCVRIDNLPEGVEPKRGIDGFFDPASLTGIDPLALRVAGVEAYNRQYGEGARKNSVPPSKSGGDPMTSPSAELSDKDGSSTGNDTPKIPA